MPVPSQPLRRVKYYEKAYEYGEEILVEVGEGGLIEFGHCEFEHTKWPGPWTAAIIMHEDGTVINVRVELIKFLDPMNIEA